jgi:hypothetical protein
MVMNKTPVKESAPQAGPHTPARQISSITAQKPVPGRQNCSGFTASGLFDTNDIMTIEGVDLVVSDTNHMTRLVQGNLSIPSAGNWTCAYNTNNTNIFPATADDGMPAMLIVRGKTTQGGTYILNVPFCHDSTMRPGAR